MGVLFYGGPYGPIEIEDTALAHLKIVITTKLRRGESFTLSWKHPEDQAGGRSTVWLHPSIPLRFTFDSPENPEISPAWLDELANSAHSTGGIRLVSEHFEPSAEADGDWPSYSTHESEQGENDDAS
ncbi:hypothetical protein [Microbacterium sp. YY-01]|uniref:DUF7882 family protein n=1 Tax=Microbacterium sp. YY-01 TaxID=3421634 RepID=UPI003D1777CB